ncbi:uncharacterized protein LOC116196838 isoform X2 [Punica granatum]|uniref:Uncharacterized protein LOC116196838 isoform X2 n=1 Tax=Punica granatum TaxID=22663 RepID=A0A6P8CJQ3_PUNGR|nr:uncharacterized protein LOC116196838 isoform X2 [Punica granatum]
MSIAVASSLSLGSSHYNPCNPECSTSYGIMSSLMKPSPEGQRTLDFPGMRNLLFGSAQIHWLHVGRNLCLSRISVAADYSDSLPDSSNYISDHGYHPLEEVKAGKTIRDTKLTSAEIARTTIEACSSGLLVFPGTVHCEPHEQISWADFQYVLDDYGDLIFEVLDSENIIEDPGASNPVSVFIGMDMPVYENQWMAGEPNIPGIVPADYTFEDDYIESVSKEYDKDMDSPSNGVSILGCLVPVFGDEEPYLRRLFRNDDDGDVYDLDWKAADFSNSSKRNGNGFNSTLYRLEIFKIELFSVYGVQCEINRDDFLDAEPDFLVHSTSTILDRFAQKGIRCNVALKALCKKKGLHVEGANLIGVDSLGMDVRIYSGIEVQTHRFPFKIRATSEAAAEKQIQQLLFPRSRRKKLRTHGDGYNNLSSH